MINKPKDYDTTLARIAGNIAAGLVTIRDERFSQFSTSEEIAAWVQSVSKSSVLVAMAIVQECQKFENLRLEMLHSTQKPEQDRP